MADDHGEEKIGESKKKNAGEDLEEQELLHNHFLVQLKCTQSTTQQFHSKFMF